MASFGPVQLQGKENLHSGTSPKATVGTCDAPQDIQVTQPCNLFPCASMGDGNEGPRLGASRLSSPCAASRPLSMRRSPCHIKPTHEPHDVERKDSLTVRKTTTLETSSFKHVDTKL